MINDNATNAIRLRECAGLFQSKHKNHGFCFNQSIKRANAQIRKSLGDVMLRFFFVQYIFVLVIYKGGGEGVTSMKLITLFIHLLQ